MIEIAALLFAAAVGVTIANWLSLPTIPMLLLSGWALTLAGFTLSPDTLSKSLELGLAFLVFASGAELDPRRLHGRARETLIASLIQMIVIGALIYGAAIGMGYGNGTALHFAVAFSASSTLVATRQLRRLGQTMEPFARFSTRVLLAQDFFVVLLLATLATLDGRGGNPLAALAKLLLLLAPALACQRWVLPRLLARRHFAEETLLLFLLAALFVFLGGSALLGLPLIVGAFFAGMVFSRFPASGMVRGQLVSLSDFFAALFFTTLAQLAAKPEPALLGKAAVFAVLILLMRPLLGTFFARRAGLESRAAVESGLLLAQVSEYALIVALVGFQSGILGREDFALIGLVTALTMTVTPFVADDRVASRLLRLWKKPRHPATRREWRDHVLMIGFGAGGKWIMKPLVDAGVEVLVVDDDPAVAAQLQKKGIACLCGDGADPHVLAEAGADRARAVLASPRRVTDALKVLRSIPGVPVIVRVFETSEAEDVRRLGGIPVMNSSAGADHFMDWFRETMASGPASIDPS